MGLARLAAGMWAAVSGLGGHSSCCQDHPIPMGQQRATAQGQPGSQLMRTHLEHRFGVHQNCVCVGEGDLHVLLFCHLDSSSQNLFKVFIYFWLCCVMVAAHRLLSSCGARAPEHMGSVAVARGLSYLRPVVS